MTNSKKSKEEKMQWLKARAWFWYHQIDKCSMRYTKNRCKELSIEFCNMYRALEKTKTFDYIDIIYLNDDETTIHSIK